MATTPQDAQASLDAIQAALKAVGGTGTAPSPDNDTLAIQAAMDAVNKPVNIITPDKGPADFLSGGYDHPILSRGAGGAIGALGYASRFPMMIPSGLAGLAALGTGHDPDAWMQSVGNLLDPTTDWSGAPIQGKGEASLAAQTVQSYPNKALETLVSGAGDIAAHAPAQPLRPRGGQQGAPQSLADQARLEAQTRTLGEALFNALLAIGGGRAGVEGLEARPGAQDYVNVPRAEPVKQQVTPTSDNISPPHETDFEARMQAAAPKPKAPEKVTPEVQEANVSGLEAPFRATPADPVSVFPKLPKYLQGAKPKMGEQGLTFASDLDKAAYIVANPRTSSARHADYLEWLAQALGTDENTALFLAKRSKAATVAIAKAGSGDVPAYLKPGDQNFKREPITPPPSTSRDSVRPPKGEPPDLLYDIAKAGGISKKSAVEVFGMDPSDTGVMRGGISRVMHNNGLEPDAMAEKLNQMGWNFRDHNGNTNSYDLIDKFEQALRGKKFYSAENADDAAEAAFRQYEEAQKQQYHESGMDKVDKALQGTRLTRTPIPPGGLDMFTQANNLRIGTGEGQPLPYTQYVRDVYPTPADEVISTIGERGLSMGKGDPTRVHLSPEDLQALNQALAARGWPKHRVDVMEKLSAAMDYALQNRQTRNEGYAPMRGAIQDEKLMGDMLKHPENYAVTARLDEFKSPRDFEKVCTP